MISHCVRRSMLLLFLGELRSIYEVDSKTPSKIPGFDTLVSVLRYSAGFIGALLVLSRHLLNQIFDIRIAALGDKGSISIFLVSMLGPGVFIVVYYYKFLKPIEGIYAHLGEQQIESIRQWHHKVMIGFWIIFFCGLGWPLLHRLYIIRGL